MFSIQLALWDIKWEKRTCANPKDKRGLLWICCRIFSSARDWNGSDRSFCHSLDLALKTTWNTEVLGYNKLRGPWCHMQLSADAAFNWFEWLLCALLHSNLLISWTWLGSGLQKDIRDRRDIGVFQRNRRKDLQSLFYICKCTQTHNVHSGQYIVIFHQDTFVGTVCIMIILWSWIIRCHLFVLGFTLCSGWY